MDSSSPEPAATEFEVAKNLVEQVIARLGLDPDALRHTDTAQRVDWTLQRGSALVTVSVGKSERGVGSYFRAMAPVMAIPSGEMVLPLFRRLLELNGCGLVNAAFGIDQNRIVVKSERPTASLDLVEIEQIILHLSAVADTYDDRLANEFGRERAIPAATP